MKRMEHLYTTFHHRLFLYALTFLGSDDEAKDAVADVFSAVWDQWHSQGQDGAVSAAFLYTLTRNRCIDLLRRDQARRNYAELTAATEPPFENDDDVRRYEERIARLQEAVDRLPEPGRAILHCCYFRRFTYQQTAEHLQLSLVVVRKNMLKVFKILRKELNNLD